VGGKAIWRYHRLLTKRKLKQRGGRQLNYIILKSWQRVKLFTASGIESGRKAAETGLSQLAATDMITDRQSASSLA